MSATSVEFQSEEVDYCLGCETGLDSDDGHRDPSTDRYYPNCCVAAEIEYLEEQRQKNVVNAKKCAKKTPPRESKDNEGCQNRAKTVREGGVLATESDEMYWACYDYIFPEDIPEGQTRLGVRLEREEEWHEAARVARDVYESECMESYYGRD